MSQLTRVVSTVTVNVDGLELGIIAGSLEFMEGLPTREAKGLDNRDILITESTEDAYGMIKFELPSTKENIQIAKTIESRSANTVSFYDNFNTEKVMRSGVTKNDSTRTIGTDGKITLEFIGTPLD